MKCIFSVIALLAACFVWIPAYAQADQLSSLLNAKTIRCTIKEGYTSQFDGKSVSTEKGAFSKKPEDNIITFAKINLKTGTAIAIGNAGTDDVIVRSAEVGLNFVSFTGSGAMVVGTVFSNKDKNGNYFFATSRHTQLLAISLPSQWTGMCEVLE